MKVGVVGDCTCVQYMHALVSSDTMSKDTSTSPSDMLCSAMKLANSFELCAADGDFPTSGDKSWDRCFESWYVGECTKDAIGLSGISGIWTFGSPYRRGVSH